MNCYEHPDAISVATCACGRGLCGTCQGKHQPPSCEPCYTAALETRITKTKRRLIINSIFAVAYLIAAVNMLTNTPGNTIVILMVLGWGFFGFRWLLDGLLGVTRLTIFASGMAWVVTYLVGSIVCSLAGFVIVPVEIVLQWRVLKALKAEVAGTPPAPITAIGAAS
ncbi:hypothetical protein [Acidocella sp. KAb 2-4]|uniref:hypothetical protein n=1 Tax=Acidocella sp. KAb 2-4 TaxID=2885158 RepID=UPI001D08DBC0|nr:hypothetical protein [Acidocella sp. KAb 2-4]MCB5943735.1 hypothetical protein [Acidocella sp. KAb 2-4]